MYGVQPGPLLFQNRPDLVWGLINSMYVGNIMLVILNLPLIGLFVRLLYIPVGILYPLIVAISVIGAYAINGSTVDLWLILIFGVIGYVFNKLDIPVAPLVLSLVLGGIMEQSFRQAMTISGGELKIFYNSGITVTLLAMSVISVALPFVMPMLRKLGSKGDES
jgi:putative tricarboxylic transport membrane protein